MNPFLTCSSLPHPLHRSPIRSPHRQSHCRPIWAIYAALKPSSIGLCVHGDKVGGNARPSRTGRGQVTGSVNLPPPAPAAATVREHVAQDRLEYYRPFDGRMPCPPARLGRVCRGGAHAVGGWALAPFVAAPLARADIAPPMLSSLPWRSGASDGGFPCLSDLRHRTLDAINIFIAPPSFAQMVKSTGSWVQQSAKKAPLLVVSLALLPKNNAGQFAACAAGSFDAYFSQIGANLQKAPAQGVDVRLGWEANIGSGSHPWGVDTPDQVPS